MSNLLLANFQRLWKNKMFRLALAGMLAFGIFMIWVVLQNNLDDSMYIITSPDTILMEGSIVAGIVSSIFSAFYIGTEYSDGTIRNKLTVGHSRISIYLVNLMTCYVAVVLMNLVYVTVIVTAGSLLIGTFAAGAGVIANLLAVSLIPLAALTAVYVLLEMLISNKAIAVTVLILVSFGLIFSQQIIEDRLNSPEYYDAYSWTDDKGNVYEEPRHKNSAYPTGSKRQFYELMYDVLPGAEVSQMSIMLDDSAESGEPLTRENHADLWLFAGYSVLILCVSSGVGMLLFQKKDIQ